jgi:molybdopterin-guanine dinucleotide biosynthesis protein A
MGRQKALLRIGGETLVERQIRTLHAVGVRDTFLSLRRELVSFLAPTPREETDGLPVGTHPLHPDRTDALPSPILLLDEEEGFGPLAGIVAAMARAGDRHLLVLAVDMPEVRPSLLSRLLSQATMGTGVAPKVGGMWEPLCAIYPPGSLDLARRTLESEARSPALLLDALAALGRVGSLSLLKSAARSLRSWNRPEDLAVTPDRLP